jgi:hypothetical protein
MNNIMAGCRPLAGWLLRVLWGWPCCTGLCCTSASHCLLTILVDARDPRQRLSKAAQRQAAIHPVFVVLQMCHVHSGMRYHNELGCRTPEEAGGLFVPPRQGAGPMALMLWLDL